MLRITIHDTPEAVSFQLEGRLAGPWAQALAECWLTTLAQRPETAVRVDLAGVTFVDGVGKEVLTTMHDRGGGAPGHGYPDESGRGRDHRQPVSCLPEGPRAVCGDERREAMSPATLSSFAAPRAEAHGGGGGCVLTRLEGRSTPPITGDRRIGQGLVAQAASLCWLPQAASLGLRGGRLLPR
jgi:hypothetical protein